MEWRDRGGGGERKGGCGKQTMKGRKWRGRQGGVERGTERSDGKQRRVIGRRPIIQTHPITWIGQLTVARYALPQEAPDKPVRQGTAKWKPTPRPRLTGNAPSPPPARNKKGQLVYKGREGGEGRRGGEGGGARGKPTNQVIEDQNQIRVFFLGLHRT